MSPTAFFERNIHIDDGLTLFTGPCNSLIRVPMDRCPLVCGLCCFPMCMLPLLSIDHIWLGAFRSCVSQTSFVSVARQTLHHHYHHQQRHRYHHHHHRHPSANVIEPNPVSQLSPENQRREARTPWARPPVTRHKMKRGRPRCVSGPTDRPETPIPESGRTPRSSARHVPR